jgi:hypothetical protein
VAIGSADNVPTESPQEVEGPIGPLATDGQTVTGRDVRQTGVPAVRGTKFAAKESTVHIVIQ